MHFTGPKVPNSSRVFYSKTTLVAQTIISMNKTIYRESEPSATPGNHPEPREHKDLGQPLPGRPQQGRKRGDPEALNAGSR